MTARMPGSVERRVYPQPDIVIDRLGPCGWCGAELVSRNGSGRYTIAMERPDDAPLLEPHYRFVNCHRAEDG